MKNYTSGSEITSTTSIVPPNLPLIHKKLKSMPPSIDFSQVIGTGEIPNFSKENKRTSGKAKSLILDNRIKTDELAFKGEWNNKGLRIQAFASLAVDPECFLIDLRDLAFFLQKIKTPDEANFIALALTEVLERDHFVFLIKDLFAKYIKSLPNSNLFIHTNDGTASIISCLVRELIRLDPDIQKSFDANIKVFSDKISLLILNDYLQSGNQNNQYVPQETTFKKMKIIFEDYLNNLCNFSQHILDFPHPLLEIYIQVAKNLQTTTPANKILELTGGYLVSQIFGTYIQDITEKLLESETVKSQKNFKDLLTNNLDRLFSESDLKKSLNSLASNSFPNLNSLLRSNKPLKEEVTRLLANSEMKKKWSTILNSKTTSETSELFLDYIRFKLNWSEVIANDEALEALRVNISYFIKILQRPLQSVTNSLSHPIINTLITEDLKRKFEQEAMIITVKQVESLTNFYKKLFSEDCLSVEKKSNTTKSHLLQNLPLACYVKRPHQINAEIENEKQALRKQILNFMVSSSKRESNPIELRERLTLCLYEAIVIDELNTVKDIYHYLNPSQSKQEYILSELLTASMLDFTFLYLAAAKKAIKSLTLLLNIGEKVDAPSFGNITPLYIAATYGYNDIIQLLSRHNPDINSRNTVNEWTPLMAAIYYSHSKTVNILLTSKSNLNQTDHQGQTALMIAQKCNHKEIMNLFSPQKQTTETQISSSTLNSEVKALNLKDSFANINNSQLFKGFTENFSKHEKRERSRSTPSSVTPPPTAHSSFFPGDPLKTPRNSLEKPPAAAQTEGKGDIKELSPADTQPGIPFKNS